MKRFTPAQTAQGIITTFIRGDYSLAVTRLREVPPPSRGRVIEILVKNLTLDERDILRCYAKDLFPPPNGDAGRVP